MDEARQLVAIVAETGRVLQVGHIFRFHPVTAVLRERLAAGALGRVRYCTGRFAGFKRPRTDVGVTQTDAIHYFDLFAYLLERAATAVTATLRDHLGRGLDDCSFTTVEYGDVPAFVEAGYFAPGTYRECVIVGEQATAGGRLRHLGGPRARQIATWTTPAGWQATGGRGGEASRRRGRSRSGARSSCSSRRGGAVGGSRPAVDVHAGLDALTHGGRGGATNSALRSAGASTLAELA